MHGSTTSPSRMTLVNLLVQEDIPTLSEVPIDYFTTIIERKIARKSRVKRNRDGPVFLKESSEGRINCGCVTIDT